MDAVDWLWVIGGIRPASAAGAVALERAELAAMAADAEACDGPIVCVRRR